MKIIIEIDNIQLAHAKAIEHMLALWQRLGSWGSSRWVSFFADGDGNFRPHITVNGKTAELDQDLDSNIDQSEIAVDFDKIWRKYKDQEPYGTVNILEQHAKQHSADLTKALTKQDMELFKPSKLQTISEEK